MLVYVASATKTEMTIFEKYFENIKNVLKISLLLIYILNNNYVYAYTRIINFYI